MPPSILTTPEVRQIIQQENRKPEKAITMFWHAFGHKGVLDRKHTNSVRLYLKRCINQPMYDKVPGISDMRASIKDASTLQEIADWHHECMSQKRIDLL